MIVIDNKLAKDALANAIASGRVTARSNPHAYLIQALINLNFTIDVRKDQTLFLPKDFSLDAWSSTEIAAAETVCWMMAFLKRIDCKSVEQLLRDVSDYRKRHPDTAKGAWPHVKGRR